MTRLVACIFDVDGVLLASPHEQAWREALDGLADPALFSTALYQAAVAGKPRLDGALAALQALGVAQAADRAVAYAERKQSRLLALIGGGRVGAFADAMRFVEAVRGLGWRLAVASSSKNANGMMQALRLPDATPLLDAFAANLCGRDLRRGKPDPEIFLRAAAALRAAPAQCLVVEDAPAGVQAAHRGGMPALGVARCDDAALLQDAELVVTSLDQVARPALADGLLRLAADCAAQP